MYQEVLAGSLSGAGHSQSPSPVSLWRNQMPVKPHENGVFHLVADPRGAAPLTLCAIPGGTLACQPAPPPGRDNKWVFSQAEVAGYWSARTPEPIQNGHRKVNTIDAANGVILDTFVLHSEAQMWSFAAEGEILRIRCRTDSDQR